MRESVHAVLEIGLSVDRRLDAPHAERVLHVVAAVRNLGHEVAPAAHLDGLVAPGQAVAPFGLADYGIGVGAAAHGRPVVERVDLDVVQAHDARREVVLGADHPFAHQVVEPLGRRVAQFEVEVGAHRRTAVARPSDRVALRDGPAAGLEPKVHAVCAPCVAFGADVLLDVVAEVAKMAVYGRHAVVECQVYGPSVPAGLEHHAGDMAVGHGHERLALDPVGLDVDAGMEMSRPELPEVGRIESRNVPHGVDIVVGIEPLSPGRGCGQGGGKQCQNGSHGSLSSIIVETVSITVP